MNMTIKDLICMATGEVFFALKHHATITNGEAKILLLAFLNTPE
jgi:hypothetical protein